MSGKACAICKCDLPPYSTVRTKCKHYYCSICLNEWVKSIYRRTSMSTNQLVIKCPICSTEIIYVKSNGTLQSEDIELIQLSPMKLRERSREIDYTRMMKDAYGRLRNYELKSECGYEDCEF